MKFKCSLFLVICVFLFSCSSSESTEPSKKTAIIRITVDSTPILMEWDYWVELWYMRPAVTVAETNGVGLTADMAKLEFVYQGYAGYEAQEMAGGRLNAYGSKTYYLEVGTEYGYDQVRFTIIGNDDNGHHINTHKDFELHYVGAAVLMVQGTRRLRRPN